MGTREDTRTCSPKCRKALSRLMGGGDGARAQPVTVTDKADAAGPFRVFLNNRHVSSHATYTLAEQAIDGWREEWDGVFVIKQVSKQPSN